MDAYNVYRQYIAVKRHFHSVQYDFFKYSGRVTATPKSFERRKDRNFFFRIARYKDPLFMLVYNLCESNRWVGEICLDQEAVDCYRKHKKTNQSLRYEFKQELKQFSNAKEMIAVQGTHPLVVRKYIRGDITLEGLTLICDILRPLAYWQREMKDDPLIEIISRRVHKYKGFMSYDRNIMKKMLKDSFDDNAD